MTALIPQRVQLSRKKGFRLPPLTVNVARPGKWGNPYRIGKPVDMRQARCYGWKMRFPERVCKDAEQAVQLFRLSVALDDGLQLVARQELRGKNLACWCALGRPCHADVLLEIANR